jgi:putative effector of murein hydrolase
MSALLASVPLHPLFGITLTVTAYAAAVAIWRHARHASIVHPVLVATILVAGALLLTGTSYADYLRQAAPLNWALSLVVLLLSIPLCRRISDIGTAGSAIATALVAGSIVAVATALALPLITGADDELLATLVPKSATAAVAVVVADRLGGVTGVTAAIVISTGIFGAVFGPMILDRMGVEDDRAKGFALGVASHAIGAARAIQISEMAGAFASIGMILNALLTIALAPLALSLIALLR